ncbi:hypothetical protein Dimus_015262 [Dionaea muscipula]
MSFLPYFEIFIIYEWRGIDVITLGKTWKTLTHFSHVTFKLCIMILSSFWVTVVSSKQGEKTTTTPRALSEGRRSTTRATTWGKSSGFLSFPFPCPVVWSLVVGSDLIHFLLGAMMDED